MIKTQGVDTLGLKPYTLGVKEFLVNICTIEIRRFEFTVQARNEKQAKKLALALLYKRYGYEINTIDIDAVKQSD